MQIIGLKFVGVKVVFFFTLEEVDPIQFSVPIIGCPLSSFESFDMIQQRVLVTFQRMATKDFSQPLVLSLLLNYFLFFIEFFFYKYYFFFFF